MLIVNNTCNEIEEVISQYEKKRGLQLPAEYRKFLMKYNGGETPNTIFKGINISSDVRMFRGENILFGS